MDYKEILIRQLRKYGSDTDQNKLNNMTKQQLETMLRKKKDEAPREKFLTFVGMDTKNRSVYRDEVGLYWKRKSSNANEKKLFLCLSFHDEPLSEMKEDIVCRFYEKGDFYECRKN